MPNFSRGCWGFKIRSPCLQSKSSESSNHLPRLLLFFLFNSKSCWIPKAVSGWEKCWQCWAGSQSWFRAISLSFSDKKWIVWFGSKTDMYTNGFFPFNSETTGPRGLGRAQTNSVTPSLKIWIHNLDLVPLLARGNPQRFLNFILLSPDPTNRWCIERPVAEEKTVQLSPQAVFHAVSIVSESIRD